MTSVIFVAYNSTITGSKILRELNKLPSTQKKLYDGDASNMVKAYCQNYDKAKSNEPYYDVLASQMALNNEEIFDRNFTYVSVDLEESGSNLEEFHPKHEDPLVFKMRSKIIDGKTTFTRKDFNTMYEYNNINTEHIFIYGPITSEILYELKEKMNTHIQNKTKLHIHFQGENILNNEGNDGDTIYGMESKGNLFKNSFNYQNSMAPAREFRRFIQETPECEAFTILCTSTEADRVTDVEGVTLKWKDNKGNESDIIGGLPKIYLSYYDDIINLINGKFNNNECKYETLNITSIYQDMVDKDNSSSIVFLLLHSIKDPNIILIGREAFELTYKNRVIPHYQFLNCSLAPKVIKPSNISEMHNNIELNMGQTTLTYWPAFKDDNYELEYSSYDTVNHYNIMSICFEMCVNDLLKYYKKKCNSIQKNYMKYIAKPSNLFQSPLLNEILFFPALNTLIKSINSIDSNILSHIHPELTQVTSNGTFLDNMRISNIYTEYITTKLNSRYSN